MYSCWK